MISIDDALIEYDVYKVEHDPPFLQSFARKRCMLYGDFITLILIICSCSLCFDT